MKRLKKKYKFIGGVQRVEMDTPDYGKAYEIQAEQNAKSKGISQVAQQFSGAYAPIGAVGGMAGDVIKNRAKNKKTGATVGGAVEMGASGAALGAQLGGPWGAAAGLVVGGTYGAIKGAKDYEKVKEEAQKAEEETKMANINKRYSEGTATDAQAVLAKKGKYKVKSKQPRLIETEGREPIFSPKKADGTRDLLYYNPNDPTHEEGGVKALVMPKAQEGKKSTKPFTWKPPGNVAEFAEAKRMSSSKAARNKQKQEDSLPENIVELVEPSGILSYDDVMRSYDRTGLSKETAIEAVGALPFVKYMKLLKGPKLAYKEYMLSKALRYGGKGAAALQAKDMSKDISEGKYNNGTNNLMPKRSKVSLLGSGNMAVGAKQLKTQNINAARFSNSLLNNPSANDANKFIQPTTGISQVARQIPEARRKEKIRTPRSHKKVNPDTNRIIDPPMLYEMKPPPPRSTFNTKNDFNKGSKKVKVYR
jgi:hypothetical protein